MLEFKQSDTAATIIVTLTELVTIPNPFYLFVFYNVTTKDVVSLVLSAANDTSLYPKRYNSFVINPSVLFASHLPGEWHYTVYQQASAVNTDPLQAAGAIELGKMYLDRGTAFAYTKYDTPQSFKAYAG